MHHCDVKFDQVSHSALKYNIIIPNKVDDSSL